MYNKVKKSLREEMDILYQDGNYNKNLTVINLDNVKIIV